MIQGPSRPSTHWCAGAGRADRHPGQGACQDQSAAAAARADEVGAVLQWLHLTPTLATPAAVAISMCTGSALQFCLLKSPTVNLTRAVRLQGHEGHKDQACSLQGAPCAGHHRLCQGQGAQGGCACHGRVGVGCASSPGQVLVAHRAGLRSSWRPVLFERTLGKIAGPTQKTT